MLLKIGMKHLRISLSEVYALIFKILIFYPFLGLQSPTGDKNEHFWTLDPNNWQQVKLSKFTTYFGKTNTYQFSAS